MRNLIVVILVFLMIFLTSLFMQSGEDKEKKLINELRELNVQSVKSVDLYEERNATGDINYSLKMKLSHDEIKTVFGFLQTASKSNISHPHFIRIWDLKIEYANNKKELKIFLDRDDNNFVYIRYNGETMLGGTVELKSDGLYLWMRSKDLFKKTT